jgi:hypothetical protein
MSEYSNFIEAEDVGMLRFQVRPTSIQWSANAHEEPHHTLVFMVDEVEVGYSNGPYNPTYVCGFSTYEEDKLLNLPLTTLRVVELDKFDRDRERNAKMRGDRFGDGIGRAMIRYFGKNSEVERNVYCEIGLNKLLFQNLLNECKSAQPISINIYGQSVVKIASCLPIGAPSKISKVILLNSDCDLMILISDLILNQTIVS